MATHSSFASSINTMEKECVYCKSPTKELKPGWQLRDGNFVDLCFTCSSAYEHGSFCKIFHWKDEGWTNCVACKKAIHCGCIMAAHLYTLMDFGGLICFECSTCEVTPNLSFEANYGAIPQVEALDALSDGSPNFANLLAQKGVTKNP